MKKKTVFEKWDERHLIRCDKLKLVNKINKILNDNGLSVKYSEITETAIVISGNDCNHAQIKIDYVL